MESDPSVHHPHIRPGSWLDKRSFKALGQLHLAFRFAEPDAFVMPPPSDTELQSRIYTLFAEDVA